MPKIRFRYNQTYMEHDCILRSGHTSCRPSEQSQTTLSMYLGHSPTPNSSNDTIRKYEFNIGQLISVLMKTNINKTW